MLQVNFLVAAEKFIDLLINYIIMNSRNSRGTDYAARLHNSAPLEGLAGETPLSLQTWELCGLSHETAVGCTTCLPAKRVIYILFPPYNASVTLVYHLPQFLCP